MEQQLSTGSIVKIFSGELTSEPIVVQYLGHKQLGGSRHRLVISDGEVVCSYTVLSLQNNHLFTDGTLSNFAICRVSKYCLTTAKNASSSIIVIVGMEVLVPGEEVGQQLGNPIAFEPRTKTVEPAEPSSSNQNISEQNGVLESKEMPVQPTVQPDIVNTVATVPIASLSPYYGRWTIKARVTSKTEVRHWKNVRGEGKLFSMDLIDESAEIRCTGFQERCDMFYHFIEVGKVYYITKCQVKPTNRRFTNIKHDFELVLNPDSVFICCQDDNGNIPMIQFDFLSIDMIETKENNSIVDVLAVVKSIGDAIELKSKATGRDLIKRDVQLVDDSNTMVTLTLWGTHAQNFDVPNNPVLAIKEVKVSEFNGGKSLTSISSTNIQMNPQIAETERLLEWFRESGQARNAKSLSSPSASSSSVNCPWLTIRQASDLNIGSPGNPNMYITKASINMIRSKNIVYKACPTDGCKKKLTDPINGMYMCEKCQKGFPNYIYRMLAQPSIFDWSGEQRVTVFGEEAEKIVGMNAQQLGQLYETLSIDAFEQVLNDCAFKSFIFKIRIKQEIFNDETKLKAVVLSVTPLDDKEYGKFLVNKIKVLTSKNGPS